MTSPAERYAAARRRADLAARLPHLVAFTEALPFVHPLDPFAGTALVAEPPDVIEGELAFTAADFHGYVATVEWVRRLAGAHHAAFLAALQVELERRWPGGFRERNREYLFLARRA